MSDEAPETIADALEGMSEDDVAAADAAYEAEGEAPTAEEPAKKPGTEKIEAVARRGARERRKLERAAKELEEKRVASQLAANERAELEEARELRKLRTEDPAAYARKVGLDLDKMTDSFLRDGKPESRVDALEKRLESEAKARAAEKAVADEAAARTEERRFAEELRAAEEEYPALADMEPEELFGRRGEGPAYRVGLEIASELKRLGYDRGPTNREIMAELNAREQAKLDKRAARLGYTKGAPKAAPGKTITQRATSQRAAAPAPPDDFNRPMSSAERSEALVRMMQRS